MSDFRVEVVELKEILPHPNADRLEITNVWDFPVVIGKGEFKSGDKAVYISVDALIPSDDPRFAFLKGHTKIKAKKLRGFYSQGLLIPSDPAWQVGQDVRAELNISKYEPPDPASMGGDNIKRPEFLSSYTDIEGLRRWPDILIENEEVVLNEKIHGTSAAYVWDGSEFYVSSKNCVKKYNPDNLWWKVFEKCCLKTKLLALPPLTVIYGEIFGWVQDLHYGAVSGQYSFIAFDAYDTNTRKFLDYDDFKELMNEVAIPTAPELYRGLWNSNLKCFAEGNTLVSLNKLNNSAPNIREGFVVKPIKERFDSRIGRVILKMVGQSYLLR